GPVRERLDRLAVADLLANVLAPGLRNAVAVRVLDVHVQGHVDLERAAQDRPVARRADVERVLGRVGPPAAAPALLLAAAREREGEGAPDRCEVVPRAHGRPPGELGTLIRLTEAAAGRDGNCREPGPRNRGCRSCRTAPSLS